MLVSSALVQLNREPRLLPYFVLLAMIAIAFIGAWFMPEPVQRRSRLRLASPSRRRTRRR